MQLSDDGCVAALFYSEEENTVRLLFWDGFQDIRWEKQVVSGGYLFFGEDGFVILARNGEGCEADYYNAQGELTESVELDGEIFCDFQNCFLMPDNRFLVITTDNAGMPYAEFYDVKTEQEEQWELSDNFFQYQIFQGTMADVLLCDSVGIYQLELGENVPTELFAYVDADLDIDGFQMVQQIDETHFAGIFNDGGVRCRLEKPGYCL